MRVNQLLQAAGVFCPGRAALRKGVWRCLCLQSTRAPGTEEAAWALQRVAAGGDGAACPGSRHGDLQPSALLSANIDAAVSTVLEDSVLWSAESSVSRKCDILTRLKQPCSGLLESCRKPVCSFM